VNTAPCTPLSVVALVLTGIPEARVIVKFKLPVPDALVAPKVTLTTPLTDGVPVIAPVEVFIESPAGKPVAL
jgi:hypothetical protein